MSSQLLGLPHVPVSRCWHQGIKIPRKLLAHTHSHCTHMPTALSPTASHPSVLLTLQDTEPAGRLCSLSCSVSKAKGMDFDPYCTYKYPKPYCRMNPCRYLREELPQPRTTTMEVQEGKERGVLESTRQQHRAPPVWPCTSSLMGLGDSREPLHLDTPLCDPCALPGTH